MSLESLEFEMIITKHNYVQRTVMGPCNMVSEKMGWRFGGGGIVTQMEGTEPPDWIE